MAKASVRSMLHVILLAVLPAGASGQGGRAPAVDTLSPSRLLPGAVIIRREIAPSCFDCRSTYITTVVLRDSALRVKGVDDIPLLWNLMPPLPDTAPRVAFRTRLVTVFGLTYLPAPRPHVVARRHELTEFERAMVRDDSIYPPVDSVAIDGRRSNFLLSTDDGLFRIDATLTRDNRLTVRADLLRCYLCP
jgi:hypothetical protein